MTEQIKVNLTEPVTNRKKAKKASRNRAKMSVYSCYVAVYLTEWKKDTWKIIKQLPLQAEKIPFLEFKSAD